MRQGSYPSPTLGQQYLGAGSLFPIVGLYVERDLYCRIVRGCEGPDVAGVVLGGIIHRHSCADHGPVSDEDATLNAHLLGYVGERLEPHYVVSVHVAGGVWVRLTTSLRDGRTTVRAAEVNDVSELRLSHRQLPRRGHHGGGR